MKKEYIEPRISVVTCSSEHNILSGSGSTGTENLNGGHTTGPGTSTDQEEVGSKFNSGMSWDEEE